MPDEIRDPSQPKRAEQGDGRRRRELVARIEGDPEHELPALSGVTRLVLWLIGAALVILGLVGLALPVVPQTVPLALGAAILSLASRRVERALARLLKRWPRAWALISRFREIMHRRLSR